MVGRHDNNEEDTADQDQAGGKDQQDLIRGIKKVVTSEKNKVTGKETVVVTAGNANATSLLRRAFLFLEDGSWQEADEYCEKVLDIDPENAEAYLAKLMSQCHARKEEDLAMMNQPLQVSTNYQKAIRFGSEKVKTSLTSYNKQIIERNEQIRLTNTYNNALLYMNSSHSESEFKYSESIFKSIAGFKDADKLAQICQVKAGECRKDAVYYSAFQRMKEGAYEDAIAIFRTVPNWRDANAQILVCQTRISENLAKKETAKKAAKKRKRIIAICISFVLVCIAFVVVLTTVIIPKSKYPDKLYLQDCLACLREYVKEELLLEFNEKTQIFPLRNGVEYLGWHIYLTDTGKVIRKVKQQTKYWYKRKLRYFEYAYAHDLVELKDISQTMSSYRAYLSYGHTYKLQKRILGKIVLIKNL